MANILYLVHRMPYPPDKGDKVRSYHLLRHLQRRHRVFLGTFIDDPQDEVHLDTLRSLCPDLYVARIDPRWRKLVSARGLLTGEPLSLAFYRHAGLRQWAREVAAQHTLQASVVFSSTMTPYAQDLLPQVPMLVDFVDVDSAKWAEYAHTHSGPMAWIYRREGERLLAHERQAALASQGAFFVTPKEVGLFLERAPECLGRVHAVSNGVDADQFRPDALLARPYAADEQAIVFTGAMDYWPNADAVQWFAGSVLPALREHHPRARLWVVGRNPTAAVRALAGAGVSVTGTVPDVRPYLQHASAVVAPLRLARGIQNKILEAMAMAQPVVTVPACAEAIGAEADQGLWRADSPEGYMSALQAWLNDPALRVSLGERARRFVVQDCSWQAHLGAFDRFIDSASAALPRQGAPAHG